MGAAAGALNLALGVLRMAGLPAATALLGVAVWRSGTLGRWGPLPLSVAFLASPLPTIAIMIAVLGGAGGVPASSVTTLDHLLISGLPAALCGAGWVLLGSVLASNGSEVRPVGEAA